VPTTFFRVVYTCLTKSYEIVLSNLSLNDYDSVLRQFMNRHWYEDEIEEMDKSISALKGYRKAA